MKIEEIPLWVMEPEINNTFAIITNLQIKFIENTIIYGGRDIRQTFEDMRKATNESKNTMFPLKGTWKKHKDLWNEFIFDLSPESSIVNKILQKISHINKDPELFHLSNNWEEIFHYLQLKALNEHIKTMDYCWMVTFEGENNDDVFVLDADGWWEQCSVSAYWTGLILNSINMYSELEII